MITRNDRYADSLRRTYRHLVGQLDQKVGREKQILRKYMKALNREIRESSPSGVSNHGGTAYKSKGKSEKSKSGRRPGGMLSRPLL